MINVHNLTAGAFGRHRPKKVITATATYTTLHEFYHVALVG